MNFYAQTTFAPKLLENSALTNEAQAEWVEEQKYSSERSRQYKLISGGILKIAVETYRNMYPDDESGAERFKRDIEEYYKLGASIEAKLTSHQFLILKMFFCEQKSVGEICTILECSFQNIYKSLKIVRKRLDIS